jgi:hypothetical protein
MLIGAPKLLAKGTSMKLRSIAIFLAVALATAAAHAQAGVYVSMDAQQFNQFGISAHPLPSSKNDDRPWLFGPGFGVYYDVTHIGSHNIKTGPIVFGLDARGDVLRRPYYGSQYDREDAILDLRIATKKTSFLKTTPYVVAGFGFGHTRIPSRTTYNNNFVYQIGVGVDRKIHGKFDWRIFEATAGALNDYPVGFGSSQYNYLINVSTGIVFRLK